MRGIIGRPVVALARTSALVLAVMLSLGGCKRTASPAEAAPAPGVEPTEPAESSPTLRPNLDPQAVPKTTAASPPPIESGERFGRFAVLPLPLRGFERLSVRERATAYHLYRASVAGRDIAFDQLNPVGLPLRRTLDRLVSGGAGLDPELQSRIRSFATTVWIGNGPHDPLTRDLWAVGFSRDEWQSALKSNGNPTVDPRVDRLLFGPGRDDPEESLFGTNFRAGLSSNQIQAFDDRYGANSRLSLVADTAFEEVYRAGRDPGPEVRPAPKGRMAPTISRIIGHLKAAEATATAGQQRMLRPLIDYLHSGSESDYERYAIAWLADRPRVDLVMGFIETDRDPHGIKGLWEGLVTLVDAPSMALMRSIAAEVPNFEARAPWDDAYRRTYQQVITTPTPVQVIVGHGDAGPVLPLGRSLPNLDGVRSKHGARKLIFMNVMRALESSVGGALINEFAPPSERAEAHRLAPLIRDVRTALVEVYAGQCAKRIDSLIGTDDAVRLREWTTPLERARIDLVVLHTLFDAGLHELVDGCDERCAETAVRLYVMEVFSNLRFAQGPDVRDHYHRAGQLIVHKAQKSGAVELRIIDGKKYLAVTDMAAMRTEIRNLLREVTRIRGVGDYEAARTLFQGALAVDTAIRDEVVLRAKRLHLPEAFAWLMPELKAVQDSTGAITDVRVTWPKSVEAQMLGWARSR
ncbi:MAG: dipeptidyl-peptidase-3 [Myxococcota bacterium]|jgi:dipeptidyl-peptidase-3